MKKQLFFQLVLCLLTFGCQTYQAKLYDFPKPVDTHTRPIEFQDKQIFALSDEGIFADNRFDGARLNDFQPIGDNTFRATISPENLPINSSPYYAFRLWSEQPRDIVLELNYTEAKHRYHPKVSTDGQHWQLLDSNLIKLAADTVNAFLSISLGADTLWVAAQEVQNTEHVRGWCEDKAVHSDASLTTVGKSKLGKGLLLLDIGEGNPKRKDIIVVLSRQHPPEITGYFAMQAFLDEILADNVLSNAFRKKYRLLVFPLMNPDGVDQGHWRHNAGGIDLNRDWAYYRQPETRQVADFIVKTMKESRSNAILGLDFHSTYYDVYYTNQEASEHIPGFKDYWLQGIQHSLGLTSINERSSNVGAPVSKNWFLTQLGAEGITYEIGDGTPREVIKEKARASAIEMMELLILR